MGIAGDISKALAKKAFDKAVHNIRNGSSKHYCPHTDSKRHHMVSSDMGMGWRVLHCDYCGWFDHKNDRHQHFMG